MRHYVWSYFTFPSCEQFHSCTPISSLFRTNYWTQASVQQNYYYSSISTVCIFAI